MSAPEIAELARKAGLTLQPRHLGMGTWWVLLDKEGLPRAAGRLETVALAPELRRLMSP